MLHHANERKDVTDTARDTSQDASVDELGPVDYAVVEFPAGHSNFTGEMTAELLSWSTPEPSA